MVNSYESPRESCSSQASVGGQDDPRYMQVVRRGRQEDMRSVRILVDVLFLCEIAAVAIGLTNWTFAVQWNPETGQPYALFSLLAGAVAFCVALCALLITIVHLSSLNLLARCAAFATIGLFLAAIAPVLLHG
jgi:hypothetical protein